eukprot:scaffold26186_cov51-Phaeocystis_antarctica.AAC.3
MQNAHAARWVDTIPIYGLSGGACLPFVARLRHPPCPHLPIGRLHSSLNLRGGLPLALPPPLPRPRLRRCGVSGGRHGVAQGDGLLELVEVTAVLRGL